VNKKIICIVIIGLFLFSNFIIISVPAVKKSNNLIDNISQANKKINNDKTTQFWAILVAPPGLLNTEFADVMISVKNNLLNSGFDENNIKCLLMEEATLGNFKNAIEFIAANDKASDTILIYLYDHGNSGGVSLHQSSLSYIELDRELDKLDSNSIAIVIEACYAGYAIAPLRQDGRVIITPCLFTKTGGFYGDFATALSEFADYKTGISDFNGVVSIEEVFNFLIEEKPSSNSYCPQMDDNYPIIGKNDGQLHLLFQDWSTGKLDQRTTPTIETSPIILINQTNFAAQSFIPTVDILTKIRLKMYGGRSSGISCKVSIRKTLKGKDLTMISYQGPRFPFCSGQLIIFDFPDIDVVPGETYYIVCSCEEESPDIWSAWQKTNADGYSKGNHFYSEDRGNTWKPGQSMIDLHFATYGKNRGENFPPIVPRRPAGSVECKKDTKYSYYVKTKDANKDKIYYKMNYGDGTESEWIGPVDSGDIVEFKNSWDIGNYSLKVKAKDSKGAESDWSDILQISVSTKKTKQVISDPIFYRLQNTFPQLLQILQRLIKL